MLLVLSFSLSDAATSRGEGPHREKKNRDTTVWRTWCLPVWRLRTPRVFENLSVPQRGVAKRRISDPVCQPGWIFRNEYHCDSELELKIFACDLRLPSTTESVHTHCMCTDTHILHGAGVNPRSFWGRIRMDRRTRKATCRTNTLRSHSGLALVQISPPAKSVCFSTKTAHGVSHLQMSCDPRWTSLPGGTAPHHLSMFTSVLSPTPTSGFKSPRKPGNPPLQSCRQRHEGVQSVSSSSSRTVFQMPSSFLAPHGPLIHSRVNSFVVLFRHHTAHATTTPLTIHRQSPNHLWVLIGLESCSSGGRLSTVTPQNGASTFRRFGYSLGPTCLGQLRCRQVCRVPVARSSCMRTRSWNSNQGLEHCQPTGTDMWRVHRNAGLS